MRTTTSPQDTALALTEQEVQLDVEIEDHAGSMVSYRTHASGNFIAGASIKASREQPIMTGEVRLRREMGSVSLAPLMNDDIPIEAGRRIVLKQAVGAIGADLSSSFVTVFDGTIGPDDPSWGGKESVIVVPFRDPGGLLADRFIADTFTYAAGLTIRQVAQEWLNDSFPGADTAAGSFAASATGGNGGASAFTRASGSFITDGFEVGDWVTATGFPTAGNNGTAKVTHVATGVLTTSKTLTNDSAGSGRRVRFSEFPIFVRGSEPSAVLQADRTLGEMTALEGLNQITAFLGGQVFRHYWHETEGRFHLYLYEPPGTTQSSVHTFAAGADFVKPSIALHKYGVRDKVIVRYTDTDGATVTASQERLSLPTYPKVMVLEYTNDAEVQGETRAQALADAAFRDTSEPVFAQACEHPTFWRIELEDTVTYAADGLYYKSNQLVVVAGFEHRFTAGSATTVIHSRGQVPLGGASRWHILQRNKAAATTINEYIQEPPMGSVVPELNLTTGALSATLRGSATASFWKVLGGTTPPTRSEVFAEIAIAGQDLGTGDVGTLATLSAGDTGYVGAIVSDGVRKSQLILTQVTMPEEVDVTPQLNLTAVVTSAGVVSAIVNAEAGWASWKVIAKEGSKPSDSEIRAATAVDGSDLAEADFGTLGTATPGQKWYVGAFAYTATSAGGDESRRLDSAVTFGVGEDGIAGTTVLDKIGNGDILAAKLSKQGQMWAFDGSISPTAHDVVSWFAGTLRFADGTTVSISAGSVTGLIAGTPNFIYWPGTGTTFSTTTSQATAIGENNVIIATVWKNFDNDSARLPSVLTSPQGLGSAESLSFDAELIRAVRLEVIQAVVVSLSALNADLGTVTAGVARSSDSGMVLDFNNKTINVADQFTVSAAGHVVMQSADVVGALKAGSLVEGGTEVAASDFTASVAEFVLISVGTLQAVSSFLIGGLVVSFGANDSGGSGVRALVVSNS